MSKFAVSFISFFDNNLKTQIIEDEDWYNAIFQHTSLSDEDREWIPSTCLEQAKIACFNCDCMIDVIKIN